MLFRSFSDNSTLTALEVGKTNAVSVLLSEKAGKLAPKSAAEYRDTLTELIRNPSKRDEYAGICREALNGMTGEHWQEKLKQLYDIAAEMPHGPGLVKKLVYKSDSEDFIRFSNSKAYVKLFHKNDSFDLYLPLFEIKTGLIKLRSFNFWFLLSPGLYEHARSLVTLNKVFLNRTYKRLAHARML